MSSSDDEIIDPVADGEDDLFGSEDEAPAEKARELSDRELDSADDEDRYDRAHKLDAAEPDNDGGRDARIQDSTVWRHPLPKPADGEVSIYIRRVGVLLIGESSTPYDCRISWALSPVHSIPNPSNRQSPITTQIQSLQVSQQVPLLLRPCDIARIHQLGSSRAIHWSIGGVMGARRLRSATNITSYKPSLLHRPRTARSTKKS